MCLQQRYLLVASLPIIDVYFGRETARRGDRDGAIPLMRAAVDHLFRAGQLGVGHSSDGVLVETLLDRGAEGDVAEAEAAIERLADCASRSTGLVIRDIWLLRLRALLARAHGDDDGLSRTCGIATATWRKRLASRGISRGPRRCHDGGCSFGGGDVSVHRCRGFDPSVGGRRGWDAGGAGRP